MIITYTHILYNTILLQPDIDECTQNPGICGLGTCNNNNGGFYDCDCPGGTMTTGSNSDNSLTCVGKCH